MSLPSHLLSVGAQCLGILDALEADIIAAQEAYRGMVGHYCQLPSPHDSTPVDGAPTPCDWSRFVSDVGLPWDASDISEALPERLPCTPICMVRAYQGILTYTVALYIKSSLTGKEYIYSRAYDSTGVVKFQDWQEVPDYDV